MAKLTIDSIESGFMSAEKINTIFQQIETAIEQCVYRDGTAPNQMTADLDLNGFTLLNASYPLLDNQVVTLGAARDLIVAAGSGIVIQRKQVFTATAAQTLFNLTTTSYTPGAGNLAVYVQGLRKFAPTDYTETSSSSFTMTSGVTLGQTVVAVTNEYLGTVTPPSVSVAWGDISGIPSFASRWPDWTEVTGKPSTFTPASHVHATTDITSGVGLADARRGIWVQASTPTATRVGDVWLWG